MGDERGIGRGNLTADTFIYLIPPHIHTVYIDNHTNVIYSSLHTESPEEAGDGEMTRCEDGSEIQQW